MVKSAAKSDFAAALSGENPKEAEHEANLNKVGIDFIPLAFEATGGHSSMVTPIAHYFIAQNSLMHGVPFPD